MSGMMWMMTGMNTHMQSMMKASGGQMKGMVLAHRQTTANMLAEMNAEMKKMNMSGDAGWSALADSVRQDLTHRVRRGPLRADARTRWCQLAAAPVRIGCGPEPPCVNPNTDSLGYAGHPRYSCGGASPHDAGMSRNTAHVKDCVAPAGVRCTSCSDFTSSNAGPIADARPSGE